MHNDKLKIMCLYYKDILVDTSIYPFFNIQCGKDSTEITLDMQGDNDGNELSKVNKYWSEITGMYWAWKNLPKSKYVGLCSYRRFFNFKNSVKPVELVKTEFAQRRLAEIDYDNIDEIFATKDIILPVPYTYAWSIRRVCSKNYNDADFDKLEEHIKKNNPEYYPAYKSVMYDSNSVVGHNMYVMKWDDFQEYCAWVFSILFAMKKKINPEDYPINKVRVFGYMHELLLPVYVKHKKMKVHRSQILWVDNNWEKSRFNSVLYRYLSNIIFFSSKILGKFYPHKIKDIL